MKPYEYMLATRETAIYPKEVALPYLVLGLTGEIGELKETIYNGGDVLKEAGDCLWYVFRLADEVYGSQLTDNDKTKEWKVFEKGISEFKELPIDGMYNRASKIAEIVKKSVRDNAGSVPEGNISDLVRCLNRVILLVSCVLNQENANTGHDYSLEQCAIANIEKLMSRKQRNVIKGSGDDR